MTTQTIIAIVAVLLAQPASPPPATAHVPAFSTRVAALTPQRPAEYLLLGEELLAESRTDADIALARRLFALAVDITRNDPRERSLCASACLALAQAADTDADRRWYRAIAAAYEPAHALSAVADGDAFTHASLHDAAAALDAMRAGDGVRARRLLDRPDVRRVIDRFGPLIAGESGRNLLDRLDREAQRWPCTECRNRRVVTRVVDDFPVTVVCPTCNADPGWNPPDAVLVGMIRFEAAALGAIQQSWGAQFAIDRATPLRTPDAAAVAPRLGVSANAPYYRSHVWTDQP